MSYKTLYIGTMIEAKKVAEILEQGTPGEFYHEYLGNLDANHLYPELSECGSKIVDAISEYRGSEDYKDDPEADLDAILFDASGSIDWIYEGVDDAAIDEGYAFRYLSEYFSLEVAQRAKTEGYI